MSDKLILTMHEKLLWKAISEKATFTHKHHSCLRGLFTDTDLSKYPKTRKVLNERAAELKKLLHDLEDVQKNGGTIPPIM